MKFKAIIFDFDGTLIDSEKIHFRAYNEVFSKVGFTLCEKTYFEHYVGLSDDEMYQRIFSDNHLPYETHDVEDLKRSKTKAYKNLILPLLNEWPLIRSAFLGPVHIPKKIFKMAIPGYHFISAISHLAKKNFTSPRALAFLAGMGAHSMLPLKKQATSAIALTLIVLGHHKGWPLPKGGSQTIADALAAYYNSLGGVIQTDFSVNSLAQLPSSQIVLFDVTPKQLLQIGGDKLSRVYKWQLKKYRYGMGVFKVDWALSETVPFKAQSCRLAPTVHLGNSMDEIIQSEQAIWNGKDPENPFVIFVQPTIIDLSRAPDKKHTAWAYCHVPNGSVRSMTEVIEKQVERFAPGFRDCILARHAMNPADLERSNRNLAGGDINGGAANLWQLIARPVLSPTPYRTPLGGIYLCSSSTPPGGGVHGMCGYHASRIALSDLSRCSRLGKT